MHAYVSSKLREVVAPHVCVTHRVRGQGTMWIGASGAGLPHRKACARPAVHGWFAEVPPDTRLVRRRTSGRVARDETRRAAASTPVGGQPAEDQNSAQMGDTGS